MSRQLPSAAITINGKALTVTQSEVLRVGLMFARRDMQAGKGDLLAVGLLGHINAILALIDATEVAL